MLTWMGRALEMLSFHLEKHVFYVLFAERILIVIKIC